MTRAVTLIAICLAAAVSFGLYQLSYEVQKLEGRLVDLNRQLDQERENIEVLNAEWAYLNRPDDLQGKIERHLADMAPVKAKQIVNPADLPARVVRPTEAVIAAAAPAARPGPVKPAAKVAGVKP